MANLPDPGIGRNPPRYRSFIPPTWGARHIALTVIGAFLLVGVIYYFFAV
jgi:hypothetical protein